jgi:uncharacterized membrane protein
MKQNSELRAQAREVLTDHWGMAAVVALIYIAIDGGSSSIPFVKWPLIILLLPLSYGAYIVFLNRIRGGEITVGELFSGFNDYGRILGTMALMALYTFLWSLLLIIPGIIKSYSYSMTPYVIKDHPELDFNGAIEESMAMMEGRKMKLFLLDLSFIGWGILCIFTLFIGLFWLYPYMLTSRAAFYEDILEDQEAIEGEAVAE